MSNNSRFREILRNVNEWLIDAFITVSDGAGLVIFTVILVVILVSCGKIFMHEGLEGFVDRIWHGPVK